MMRRHVGLIVSEVETAAGRPIWSVMTEQQMMFRAEQAEQLRERYEELERERERSRALRGGAGGAADAPRAGGRRDLLALPRRGRYALAAAARLRHQVAARSGRRASTGAARRSEIGAADDRFCYQWRGEREQPPGRPVRPGGRQAARRQLGPAEDPNSRSVASIVAGNVFTLFNAIIGVFFILILALGLFADALFGFIAIINSYIGIRQELKAKEMLESLALLVAPRAKAIRDGAVVEVRADEVVPGDFVRVEPGDQLVADGEVVESRGLTAGRVDADRRGRRGPQAVRASGCSRARSRSRARATTRSTPSARTATRPRSPARRAGSAIPLAAAGGGEPGAEGLHLAADPAGRDPDPRAGRAQHAAGGGGADGDRRPDHLDPRGPGAADERHPRGRRGPPGPARHAGAADGGDGVAGRRGHHLRGQDRHPDHRRAEAGRGRGRRRLPVRGRAEGAGALRRQLG